MIYQEYKQSPMGWKGVVLDQNAKPHLWLHSDGTWILDKQINNGPFGGDHDKMINWMRVEGFLAGEARCSSCNHTWTAIDPNVNNNGSLMCPRCNIPNGMIFTCEN